MKTNSKQMAMGGVFAALAVIIMNFGGLIPVATYTSPVLCMVLLKFVLLMCGKRLAWAWYAAVAVLSLLMSPDKEAAAVFLFLGYYPILKPKLDARKGKWLWKALLFNCATLILYWLLLHIFGMAELASEMDELGIIMVLVLLLMGNVTFFTLDRLLTLLDRRLGRKR